MNESSDVLTQQIMFAKYFFIMFGCNISNEDIKNIKKQNVNNVNCFNDFVVHYDKFFGLNKRDVIFKNEKEAISAMNKFVSCMIGVVKNKLVIHDSFLVFCFEYCQEIFRKSGNDELLNKFIQSLNECIKDCLTGENDRNYLYFKEYLLFSNILYYPTIFKTVNALVDAQLMKQKEFIWNSVKQEEKNDSENWSKLLEFGSDFKGTKTPRQDKIKNGLKPDKSERELYITAARMEDDNAEKSQYNVFTQYNNKVYLTQVKLKAYLGVVRLCVYSILMIFYDFLCLVVIAYTVQCLTYAHENNGKFQRAMMYAVNNGKYSGGPVKKFERCLVKSNTDYVEQEYPSVACIQDFMRCSFTYDSVGSLLSDVNSLVKTINDSNNSGAIWDIVRIKNGFQGIKNWQSVVDAQYCDIKLNVIYYDRDSKTSMICEVQFLLDFLKKAKEMGHKYYSLSRRVPFIQSVSNIVHNVDKDYQMYSNKIYNMVTDNNINELGKELLLKPHIVISMLGKDKDTRDWATLLMSIGSHRLEKMFNLFLDCLFYYCKVFLDEDLKNSAFLTKYLNFNNGNTPMMFNIYVYGFDVSKIGILATIERVMQQACFKGMNEMDGGQRHQIILTALIWYNCIEYIRLVLKYKEKYLIGFSKCLNYVHGNGQHTLMALLLREHIVSQEWLKFLFDVSLESKVRIDEKAIKDSIQLCEKNIKQNKDSFVKYKEMIQDYQNKFDSKSS